MENPQNIKWLLWLVDGDNYEDSSWVSTVNVTDGTIFDTHYDIDKAKEFDFAEALEWVKRYNDSRHRLGYKAFGEPSLTMVPKCFLVD